MKDMPFQNTDDSIKQNLEKLKKIQNDDSLKKQDKKVKLRTMLKSLADGQWTVIEDIMIDVIVGYRTEILLDKRDKIPSTQTIIDATKTTIEERFSEDKEVVEVLTASMPSITSVRKWFKKSEWKEEVDKRMRDETLFSSDKRAKMVNTLYKFGLNGSAKHSEMWLKMSGDLGKEVAKDPIQDQFSKIQKALSKKKE